MGKFLITTVSVGQEADLIGKSSLPLIRSYAQKCKADFKILRTSNIAKVGPPFYEKLQIKNLLDDFDRVLYIDLDILISPLSPNIFGVVPEDVFAATSVESVLHSAKREKKIITDCLGPIEWKSPYFNSGVMLFGQSSKPMLEYAQEKINYCI